MFLIIGKNDVPLYEANLFTVKKEPGHLTQFLIHSALDVVDEEAASSPQMYLRAVDRFNDLYVSAYVTAGNLRLMMAHEARNEEGIRNFFIEVHELLVKAVLNPFFDLNKGFSQQFDARVRSIAKRYLL